MAVADRSVVSSGSTWKAVRVSTAGGRGLPDSPGNVIWDWKGREARQERARTHLRRRRLVMAAVVVAMAPVLKFVLEQEWSGELALLIGVMTAGAALGCPRLLIPVERMGARLGHVVCVLLTWLLLVPFFILCVVPIGLLRRLRGQDVLCHCPLEPGLTGWIPRRLEPTPESFLRQFLVEDRTARALRRPVGPPSDRAWPATDDCGDLP